MKAIIFFTENYIHVFRQPDASVEEAAIFVSCYSISDAIKIDFFLFLNKKNALVCALCHVISGFGNCSVVFFK